MSNRLRVAVGLVVLMFLGEFVEALLKTGTSWFAASQILVALAIGGIAAWRKTIGSALVSGIAAAAALAVVNFLFFALFLYPFVYNSEGMFRYFIPGYLWLHGLPSILAASVSAALVSIASSGTKTGRPAMDEPGGDEDG